MTEIWKPVPGYEMLYEVSDLGRLRRVSTYGSRPKPLNRIITPHRKWTGYVDYWLWSNGKPKRRIAHRLIWESFNGTIPSGLQINHKNGLKNDNRLENLEVVTVSVNMAHSFRVLGRPAPNNPNPGERNGSAKLTEAKVREIRKLFETGVHKRQIAKMFGVTPENIHRIVTRRNWAHVE